MAWIKVDDSFYDNDKMLAAGSIGRDLYWHGMAYCNRNLTDGLIPKGRALSLVDFTDAAVITGRGGVDGQACAPIAVDRLLDADLWHEEGHNCPTCVQPGPRHYVIHDYLKYQPSRSEVEKKAAATKARVEAWRSRQGGNSVGNSVTNSVTNDAQTAHKHDNPNPNPNPNTSLVTKEGRVALVDAREPSLRCTKHENETGPVPPCRGCATAREAHEAWTANRAAEANRAKAERRTAINNCQLCDDNGMTETRHGLVRCAHGSTLMVVANA